MRGLLRGPDAAQKGVLADDQQKTLPERLCRPTAERKGKMTDQPLHPRRSSPVGAGKAGSETLRENLLTTMS